MYRNLPDPLCTDPEEAEALVLDNGSHNCKIGYAGDDGPRDVFSTLVGKPKNQSIMIEGGVKSWFVADEIKTHRGELATTYPIEHGIVTNWDDMEKIWHHAFYSSLRGSPEERPVLLTEAVLNPRSNRQKMIEVIFEKFHTPGSYVALQPVLALYACGRGSAITCESGDGVTQIVPIYEGYALHHAIQRVDFAGRDITQYLSRLLQKKGRSFNTTNEMEIVRDMKQQICYVAEDYDAERLSSATEAGSGKSYQLPDGSTVSLNDERFTCTEALFRPALVGQKVRGVHEALYDCLKQCDMDCRRDFNYNLILSGGNTKFPGMPERLLREMVALVPSQVKTKVIAAPDRMYAAWIGGSIEASLSTFQQWWILRQEYEEYGPEIVHRKCM